MSRLDFSSKLIEAADKNNSLLCVGLDPDPQKYSAHFPDVIDGAALLNWGRSIIRQTVDLVCCYKPNLAFYLQYGTDGLEALQQTIAAIPAEIPVLLDVKWGDIGSTASAYARAAFDHLKVDAVTLSPFLGKDSIASFLTYPGKATFVLCHTSNPSAADIQHFGDRQPLYQYIATEVQSWGDARQIGFVVGATQPQALQQVRSLAPDNWILAPGVGPQGGNLEETVAAGLRPDGAGLIVPVSRAVIYANNPRQGAETLRHQIQQARITASSQGSHQELILKLHDAGCIQFGQFRLASGRQSPIYIDLRRMSGSPALMQLAAKAYATLIDTLTFNHIAAVPYAALTIGTAVALTSGSSLVYPRKEVKTYGTGKNVEGVFAPGDTVVVIEDLVTSGGSVLKAIDQLRAAQLRVTDVVVLIDREQGGPENLAAAGYRLHAIFKLSEILQVLHRTGRVSDLELERVVTYLKGE